MRRRGTSSSNSSRRRRRTRKRSRPSASYPHDLSLYQCFVFRAKPSSHRGHIHCFQLTHTQQRINVVPHGSGGGGGEQRDGQHRKLSLNLYANLAVRGAKALAPLGDTVGLVEDHARELRFVVPLLYALFQLFVAQDALGREEEQRVLAGGPQLLQVTDHLLFVFSTYKTVEDVRVHAALHQRRVLVLWVWRTEGVELRESKTRRESEKWQEGTKITRERLRN